MDYCGEIYPSEPYNLEWSYPQQIVASSYEWLDGYYGLADDIVPSIFVETYSNKLMIVYAHGWEAKKYHVERQTARLNIMESSNAGYNWSTPRLAYNSPETNFYDSKPSCTGLGYGGEILCTFYKRDRATSQEREEDDVMEHLRLLISGIWEYLP